MVVLVKFTMINAFCCSAKPVKDMAQHNPLKTEFSGGPLFFFFLSPASVPLKFLSLEFDEFPEAVVQNEHNTSL